MSAESKEQHKWLQKLVGEWSCITEAAMSPGETPIRVESSEIVRSLGGVWIVAEGSAKMPDGVATTTIMTLGYDPQQNQFVGTFVGSMMNYLWIYTGQLNESETVLTLATEGPGMSPGSGISQYKDIIEIHTEDQRTFTSHVLEPDGKWHTFMTATYRRKS